MAWPAAWLDRLTDWIRDDFAGMAPAWLQGQRWYGAKTRPIDRVRVADVFWLPADRLPCALVVVDVESSGAGGEGTQRTEERYALLLGFSSEAVGCPTVGHVDWQPGLAALDVAAERSAILALLSGLASGQDAYGVNRGAVTYGDATSAASRALGPGSPDPLTVLPVGLEQSNTSVRVGPAYVFKLFRRLDVGENPQVEVGRFLATRTSFRAAPSLEGSVTYRTADGRAATLGVLEGWVDSIGDGWSYVVAKLEQSIRGAATLGDLTKDLFVLGGTTADLHAALASDADAAAFAPEPVTASDVEAWRATVLAAVGRVTDLVERRRHTWTQEAGRLAEVLLRGRADSRLQASPPPIETGRGFHKIRVHGDYHLGQTLKTAEGFALIDFEGEPARSLADRRIKQCALKDVAGMLRSVEYAVEAVRAHSPEGAQDLSLARFRSAFLDGYLSRATSVGAVFVPADRQVATAWIAFFECERALYEVEYEANSRPSWVHIPLRGVVRILTEQET